MFKSRAFLFFFLFELGVLFQMDEFIKLNGKIKWTPGFKTTKTESVV